MPEAFDFNFPFENKHRFENFFGLIMEGIGTLLLFKFRLSQNYCNVMATINHSFSIFLLDASLMSGFMFHVIKILIFDKNIIVFAVGSFLKSFGILSRD